MSAPERDQIRSLFRDVWRRYRLRKPLSPTEGTIADVIAMHPEYHDLLEDEHVALDHDYDGEDGKSNPFLHMGMHIALHEQISAAHAPTVAQVYGQLTQRLQDRHAAEHQMMECLGKVLWEAQHNGTAPDQEVYAICLQRLLTNA